MYFETASLKTNPPNDSWLHRKIILYNIKTREFLTVRLGMATDRKTVFSGYTHWLKKTKKNKSITESSPSIDSTRVKEAGERMKLIGEVERLSDFLRDIDLITDYADFDEVAKYKMIEEVINSYNKTIKT